MSTHSMIAVHLPNGKYRAVYCHSDGYYSYNGVRLMDSWHSIQRAAILTNQGDISSLGRIIGKRHDFDWRSKLREYARHEGLDFYELVAEQTCEVEEWTLFYRRDRGDKSAPMFGEYNTRGTLMAAFDDSMCQYAYLFAYETWWTPGRGRDDLATVWRPLASVLAEDKETQTVYPNGVTPGPCPYLAQRTARLAIEDRLIPDQPVYVPVAIGGRRPLRL